MIKNLDNFRPTCALEAFEFLEKNSVLSYPLNIKVDWRHTSICVISITNKDDVISSFELTDRSDFRVAKSKLINIVNACTTYNNTVQSIDKDLNNIIKENNPLPEGIFDQSRWLIKMSPCLYQNVEHKYKYTKLRLEHLGIKLRTNHFKLDNHIQQDRLIIFQIDPNNKINTEALKQSIDSYIDTMNLPFQIRSLLFDKIVKEKGLVKNALSKPLNLYNLSEFGSFKPRWVVETTYKTLEDVNWRLLLAVPINGGIKRYTSVKEFEGSDLADPTKSVGLYMECGPICVLYISDSIILVADTAKNTIPESGGYSLSTVLLDPKSWELINPRDEWTKLKVLEAVANMEV